MDQVEQLSQSISSLSSIVPGLGGKKDYRISLPRVGFVAQDKRFTAELAFTPEQAATVLGIIGSGFCQKADAAPQGSSSGSFPPPPVPQSGSTSL
jgi:hypothetical protein